MAERGRYILRLWLLTLLLPVVQLSVPAPKVVVVGGGLAGLQAVRQLRKGFEVTLVDAKEYFEFLPSMVQPYAAPDVHGKLVLDYDQICKKMKVAFHQGLVQQIDNESVLVVFSESRQKLSYDYCLVASGCGYGDLWAWSPRTGARLAERREFIDKESKALRELDASGAHVAIVGSGFVGVEFATELRHVFRKLRITLVGRRGCSGLGAAEKYVEKSLEAHDIKLHRAAYENVTGYWQQADLPEPQRIYFSVGVQPQCDFLPKECLEKGWVKVTPSLQVASGPQDTFAAGKVFAVGNCVAQVPGLVALPKNSFPAEHMAAHAARNVRRSAQGRALKPFSWPLLSAATAISLGPRDGVLTLTFKKKKSLVVMKGRAVVWLKEFIRKSKVDECRMGFWGRALWRCFH